MSNVSGSTTNKQYDITLSLTVVSDSQIDLSWSLDSDISDVSTYRLEVSDDSLAWSTLIDDSGDSLFDSLDSFYSHDELERGSTKYYRVIGLGGSTERISGIEEATTWNTPGIPTNLTVTVDSDTQITLSWGVPEDNGGDNITEYLVEYSDDDGTSWEDISDSLVDSVDTEYVHNGLTSGTNYSYRVSATNSVGTGNSSIVVDGTTYSVPGVPRNLSAVSTSSTQIYLTWLVPSTYGGSFYYWLLYRSVRR